MIQEEFVTLLFRYLITFGITFKEKKAIRRVMNYLVLRSVLFKAKFSD